jgi:hypothetical protein
MKSIIYREQTVWYSIYHELTVWYSISLKDHINVDEQTTILYLKINEIKNIFPYYDDGILSSYLDVYIDDHKELIQLILGDIIF